MDEPQDDPVPPNELQDLASRIERAQGRTTSQRPTASGQSGAVPDGLAMGMRIGLELVAGVAVGVGIGLLLNWAFGIRWALIPGFFLGVAAGMANVYRTVRGLGLAVGYRPSVRGKPDRQVPGRPVDDGDED